MKPLDVRPQQRHRLTWRLVASLAALSVLPIGLAAGAQPPKMKSCAVAVVDKDLLDINCPKGRLGELLTALHDLTGMESDISREMAASPVSVVLDKATLQVALDMMLARYNYSLDGTPVLTGGRAAGTKVTVYSLREAADGDRRNSPPMDVAPAPGESTSSRYQQESAPPSDAGSGDPAQPAFAEPQISEASGSTLGMPAADPEQAAKAREAFFAKLPTSGATLPPGAAQAELPPSRQVQNSTGPGDGRRGLPLPDFTPGAPTRTPPGMSQ